MYSTWSVNHTDSGANVVNVMNSGDTLVGAAGGVIEVARISLIRLPHDNGIRSKGRNLVSFPTDLKGRDRPVNDVTGVLLPALFEKGGVGSVQRAPVHLIVAKIFPKRAGLKVRDRFGKRGSANTSRATPGESPSCCVAASRQSRRRKGVWRASIASGYWCNKFGWPFRWILPERAGAYRRGLR